MIELNRKTRLRILISCVAILLFYTVLQSNWYEIKGEGEFTMGPPKESNFTVTYDIEPDSEDGSFKLGRATPFINWMSTRDSDSNQTSPPGDSDSGDETESKATDYTRYGIKVMGVLLICSLIGRIFYEQKHSLKIAFVIWMVGALLFSVGIPLSLGMDNGDDLSEGETPIEEPTPESEEFPFFSITSDMDLIFGGVQFNFNASGYDSGLLTDEEISNLSHAPPQKGDVGYDEFVAFEGSFSLKPSKGFHYWLMIPLFWLIEIDFKSLKKRLNL